MIKDLLQQELLEKVKPGMKPSDIKKQVKNSQKDDGYESDKSDKIPTAPLLPNQNLLNQITSLKKQLQVYKDFRESDMKIKEKLQQENKSLKEKVSQLEKPGQNQPEKATKSQSTQTTPTSFYCDNCQQTKHGTYLIRKIDSPFEPRTHKKLCYICSTCRKYTKEFAEVDWKEQPNPYKLYD